MIKIILENKNNNSINLKQNKNMIYVGDIIKIIGQLITSKKKNIYKKIKSTKFYIGSIYIFLKKYHSDKTYDKIKKYKSFITTYNWYIKYYGKKK